MGTWPTIGLTNVVDVTHNHANPRAKCTNAESVFRGTAFHLATKEQSTPNAFLRRDFRQRADYIALKKLICNQLKTGIFS